MVENQGQVTGLDQALLASMREHPHHDTLPELLTVVRADGDAVAESLDRLRRDGLVQTAAGHWQLTAAGWRLQRAA